MAGQVGNECSGEDRAAHRFELNHQMRSSLRGRVVRCVRECRRERDRHRFVLAQLVQRGHDVVMTLSWGSAPALPASTIFSQASRAQSNTPDAAALLGEYAGLMLLPECMSCFLHGLVDMSSVVLS